jgi:hypothetical protein
MNGTDSYVYEPLLANADDEIRLLHLSRPTRAPRCATARP